MNTFYEIIILDYGKLHNETKIITVEKQKEALEAYNKYIKKYGNIRVQRVTTKWII